MSQIMMGPTWIHLVNTFAYGHKHRNKDKVINISLPVYYLILGYFITFNDLIIKDILVITYLALLILSQFHKMR